jgi:Repeat of unknown function (DUF5907)
MSYTPPIGSATTSAKGTIKLAGDLAGTADLPTVPGLANKSAITTTVTGTNSITGGGDLSANRTLSLVGDAASPGNTMYYGTNGSGTKGYYTVPSSAVATTIATGTITLAGDLAGTGASPSVAKIKGVTLPASAPSNGQVLTATGATTTSWSAVDDTAAVKLAGSTMTGKLIVPTFQVTGGTLAAGKVLTSDASGNATWQLATGATNIVTVSGTSYTASSGDFVLVTNSGAAVTITLPALAAGARIGVKKANTSSFSVTVSGATIDNTTSWATADQWVSQDFICSGTQWYLV